MKKRDDCHAATIGYGLMYQVAEDILSFAKSKQLRTELVGKIESEVSFLKDVGGEVGGVGEFVYQNPWVVRPYLKDYADLMEKAIKDVIPGIHNLAEAVASGDPKALEEATAQLRRELIGEIRFRQRRYAEALVSAANPSPKTKNTSSIRDEYFLEKNFKEINNKNW